jgi:apolipoprotein N-acyltransferase
MSVVEAARSRAPTARVGLVQPGTDALDRWREDNRGAILGRLTSLTKGVEKSGVDLTVWPEASYPFPVAHWTRHCPTGDRAILPFGVKGPVLTGMVMTSANGALYNSAVICSTEGDLSDPYDKINLLWFGETIPIVGQIPWVRERFLHGRGLVAGRKNVILTTGPIRASVLNCFEDVLPSAGREAMEGGPNLLVNVTNDAWFFGTYESEFHARFAALRAVEERRDLVRAVNLGPTTWVDAAGRVRARYADSLAGTLLAQPALLDTPVTVFGLFGDWPLIVALVVVASFVLVRTKRKERRTLEPQG